ncbi:MAG: YdcF family protein [Ruminococcus sp.]|nr:YdcF family protein [Ruminococcus sp.]
MKRLLLIIPELLLFAVFSISPIANEGMLCGMIFAVCLIVITLIFPMLKKLWEKRAGRTVLGFFPGITIIGGIYAAVLSGMMIGAMNAKAESPEVLIVLGCQVIGDEPSEMLQSRLDAAYDAMEKYPDAICIVTGGKGNGEGITEAECMIRYLTKKGADSSRIIAEDKATSTEENLKYFLQLTDKRDIAIVTDGFHQYRGALAAKNEGAQKVRAICADTDIRVLPSPLARIFRV